MDLIEIIMNGINCTPPLHPYGDEHPEDDKPLNKDGSVINPYSSDSSEDIGQIRFEDLKTTLEEDEDLHPNLNTKNTKSTGYQFFAKLIEAAGWWFMFTVSLTGNPIFLTISAGCLGIAGFHKAFGKNQAVRTLLQDWINWSWENGNNKPSSGDIEITFFDLPTNQIAILRRGRI